MKNVNCVYVHLILKIENDKSQIMPEWQKYLSDYIENALRRHEQKPIEINAHFDHIHILTGLNLFTPIDELVAMVKTASKDFARYINEICAIAWTEDYVCVSVGGSELEDVARFIRKQKELHQKKNLSEEIVDLMDQIESDIPQSLLHECGFMLGPRDYSTN
jgi:REP element-mobilizing transposase RayT